MPDPLIKPTIGRRVWYWPSAYDCNPVNPHSLGVHDRSQPLDAGVAYVWNDRMVNVSVADQDGQMHNRTSVRLLQESDAAEVGEAHVQWMPHQAGQAKKAAEQPTIEDAVVVLQAHAASLGLELVDPTEPRATPLQLPTHPLFTGGEPAIDPLPKFLTMADIESVIVREVVHVVPDSSMLYCTLFLRNGAKVTGHNFGAIDPARQDWEIGRKAARDMAVESIWPLEGYLLRQKLYDAQGPQPD